MNKRENRVEIIVGAFVFVTALAFSTLLFRANGPIWQSDTLTMSASFRSVEGVTTGSDIRVSGVKVGTVGNITLNPTTFRADVSLLLDQDLQLPTDTAAVIASEGLLGGNFVELVPGGALENLTNGSEIEDTQGAVSLISLLMKFVGGEGGQN